MPRSLPRFAWWRAGAVEGLTAVASTRTDSNDPLRSRSAPVSGSDAPFGVRFCIQPTHAGRAPMGRPLSQGVPHGRSHSLCWRRQYPAGLHLRVHVYEINTSGAFTHLRDDFEPYVDLTSNLPDQALADDEICIAAWTFLTMSWPHCSTRTCLCRYARLPRVRARPGLEDPVHRVARLDCRCPRGRRCGCGNRLICDRDPDLYLSTHMGQCPDGLAPIALGAIMYVIDIGPERSKLARPLLACWPF